MWRNSMRENREASQTPDSMEWDGRRRLTKSRKVDMNVCRESDGLIVPTKRANKVDAYALAAESAEGRRATKPGMRAQGLWRVRQAVSQRAAGRHINPR